MTRFVQYLKVARIANHAEKRATDLQRKYWAAKKKENNIYK
jgi:hypothetical protein